VNFSPAQIFRENDFASGKIAVLESTKSNWPELISQKI